MLTAQLGDTLAVMVTRIPLNKVEAIKYALIFRDLPTGESEEIDFIGENDAVMAFAAWLAADEESLGSLEKYRTELRSKLNSGLFLP
jgi:hypothetical protein